MITKETACHFVLSKFASEELGMKPGNIDFSKIPQESVRYSSTVAVAMEYLGLLTEPEYMRYASTRSGIIYVPSSESELTPIISFREFLDSLAQ